MRTATVLVVDDEPSILESTRLMLVSLGCHVLTTDDPRQVVPLVRAHRPDVLLQDVRMPHLDLPQLVRDLRATPEGSRLRVVLFSAGMDLDEVQARVQADGILEKPFQPGELAQAVLAGDVTA